MAMPLARANRGLGEMAPAAESNSQGYQLLERVSDVEKFVITASYDLDLTGNLERRNRPVALGGHLSS